MQVAIVCVTYWDERMSNCSSSMVFVDVQSGGKQVCKKHGGAFKRQPVERTVTMPGSFGVQCSILPARWKEWKRVVSRV